MIDYFQNIKNTIDFWLRQNLKFSRKNYNEKNEPKKDLIVEQEQINQEKYLVEKYNLEDLKNSTTKINYLENLYTLDILDKYLKIEQKKEINALDIGSKNWFYAKGEYFFFKNYCEEIRLNGVEIDSNRLYLNFYSRKEVAKFHIKNLQGASYLEKDFLKHGEKYDYIIWILPFIKKYPLLKWGLPFELFKPYEMLKHAYNSLKENGQLLIINQGKEEFEIQKQICQHLSINIQETNKVESCFSTYKIDRYSVLLRR